MDQDIYHSGEYWEQNATFHEEDALHKAENCRDLLQKHSLLGKPLRVADIGCGSGKFLYELSSMIDGTFRGIDVSTQSITAANERHKRENITFERSDLAEITDTFDLVTMNDVFEHVDDYIGFLRMARGRAAYFYFNIPLDMTAVSVLRHSYMKWRESVGHLHYFSKNSALATLEYAGFEIIGWQYNQLFLHEIKTRPTVKSWIGALPRWVSYKISPDFSVKLLGGASLSVVCGAGK